MLLTILALPIAIAQMQLFIPATIEIGTNLQVQLDLATHGLVFAQFQATDILGNMQNGWQDFLQTGKAGTLAIGLVLGYMIRGVTR